VAAPGLASLTATLRLTNPVSLERPMARRSFDVVDLMELFVHWEAGRSQVQIAQSLNLDRKTVRKYLGPAVAEGLSPGAEPVGEQVWAGRIARWFPELTDTRLRQVTWAEIDAHRDFITAQLKDGVTMATVAHRLADDLGVRRRNRRSAGGSTATSPRR
jgi:hypothetical protein